MPAEVLVVNPGRGKHKKRKVHKKHRRHVARKNPANPTRRHRRRHNPPRRRYRRHYVRNPRLPFGIDLTKILSVSGGFIGTELAGGWLAGMLPAEWKADPNKANLVRIGCKAAIGIGVPMLAGKMLPRGLGPAIAIGGGVAVVIDLFKTYLGPAMGLSDYEYGQLGAYEPETIGAIGAGDDATAFGSGAF